MLFACSLLKVWQLRSDVLLTLPHHLSTFSLKFKYKVVSRKKKFIIKKKKKSHFSHVTIYELTLFQKMVRVKTRSLLFCVRYDPLIVFRKQNHNFQFHKTMSHDLELQKKVTYGCGLDPNRIQWGVEQCSSNVLSRCWCWVVAWWIWSLKKKLGCLSRGVHTVFLHSRRIVPMWA